jgi:NADH:ubiquinone oxidoreductase subunit 5 (subunit L)/multisubunit Na+/H+ antiporter MnhA subunit
MTVLLAVSSGHLVAGALAILGALFTLLYLVRLFNRVFLGEVRIRAEEDKRSLMVLVVLLLGVLSLLLGVFFRIPLGIVDTLIK